MRAQDRLAVHRDAAIAGLVEPGHQPQQRGLAAARAADDGEVIAEPRADVGVIFQEPRLFPWLSVSENVGFGLSHLSAFEREGLVTNALVRVGLAGYEKRWPRELSGGQQQRVAIARALAMDPIAMLFDEPTSALDPEMINEVLDVMIALAKEGMTMIVVTHEMGFARKVANRVVFMDKGEIVEDAPTADFFGKPRSERAQMFLSKILQH